MRSLSTLVLLFFLSLSAAAQFPPAAGQPGSTAIHKDSSLIAAWAVSCTVQRGYQDISDTALGLANVGDSSMALGPAGTAGVVSLGDGGRAILSFAEPMPNGPGWDFAVFENSFSDDYLELAFVEVSSDGLNFFRFPATSLSQDSLQVGSFGSLDPTQINNLAGKYRALFGTPFDLDELSGTPGLDLDAISHIKIIDVVGSLQDSFATYDHLGNKINDPWPTPFPSGGFDLDAVAVLNHPSASAHNPVQNSDITLFPNPAGQQVHLQWNHPEALQFLGLYNALGQLVYHVPEPEAASEFSISVAAFPPGNYIWLAQSNSQRITQKLRIQHD